MENGGFQRRPITEVGPRVDCNPEANEVYFRLFGYPEPAKTETQEGTEWNEEEAK